MNLFALFTISAFAFCASVFAAPAEIAQTGVSVGKSNNNPKACNRQLAGIVIRPQGPAFDYLVSLQQAYLQIAQVVAQQLNADRYSGTLLDFVSTYQVNVALYDNNVALVNYGLNPNTNKYGPVLNNRRFRTFANFAQSLVTGTGMMYGDDGYYSIVFQLINDNGISSSVEIYFAANTRSFFDTC